MVGMWSIRKRKYLFVGEVVNRLKKYSLLRDFINKVDNVILYTDNIENVPVPIRKLCKVIKKGELCEELSVWKVIDNLTKCEDRKFVYEQLLTSNKFNPGLLTLLENSWLKMDERERLYEVLNVVNENMFKVGKGFVEAYMAFAIPCLGKSSRFWIKKKNEEKEQEEFAKKFKISLSEVRKCWSVCKLLKERSATFVESGIYVASPFPKKEGLGKWF